MKRPKLKREEVEFILSPYKLKEQVRLLGIRGYYLDSMGKKGENDRNLYDDAIFIISPRLFVAFPANTDPSIYKFKIASLTTGVHYYKKGKHRGLYWALRLVNETAPVTRDGLQGIHTGIALNIHKGGRFNTGSEGCQTIHPDYWDEFIELVYQEMDFYNQKSIPYCLIDETTRRKFASSSFVQNEAPAAVVKSDLSIPSQTQLSALNSTVTNFPVYIPQITTIKNWIKTAAGANTFAIIASLFAGLPYWVITLLIILLMLIVIGCIVIFVKYYSQVFSYVEKINLSRASNGEKPEILGSPPKN